MHGLLVLRHHALGDFDIEEIVGNLVLGGDAVHDAKDVAQLKIQAGEVHGHGNGRLVPVQRFADSRADLPDDAAVQQVDDPHALQHGDELIRANHSVVGVHPARQRLKAAQLPGNRADDGLVIGLDIPPLQCGVKVALDVLHQVGLHGGRSSCVVIIR